MIPDYGDYDDSQGRGHSRRPQGLCLVLACGLSGVLGGDMMTDEENELICEKLLGWEKVLMPEDNYPAFKRSWCHDPIYAPSFTTWADAGLILDALNLDHASVEVGNTVNSWYCEVNSVVSNAATAPLAIRAAALAYLAAT